MMRRAVTATASIWARSLCTTTRVCLAQKQIPYAVADRSLTVGSPNPPKSSASPLPPTATFAAKLIYVDAFLTVVALKQRTPTNTVAVGDIQNAIDALKASGFVVDQGSIAAAVNAANRGRVTDKKIDKAERKLTTAKEEIFPAAAGPAIPQEASYFPDSVIPASLTYKDSDILCLKPRPPDPATAERSFSDLVDSSRSLADVTNAAAAAAAAATALLSRAAAPHATAVALATATAAATKAEAAANAAATAVTAAAAAVAAAVAAAAAASAADANATDKAEAATAAVASSAVATAVKDKAKTDVSTKAQAAADAAATAKTAQNRADAAATANDAAANAKVEADAAVPTDSAAAIDAVMFALTVTADAAAAAADAKAIAAAAAADAAVNEAPVEIGAAVNTFHRATVIAEYRATEMVAGCRRASARDLFRQRMGTAAPTALSTGIEEFGQFDHEFVNKSLDTPEKRKGLVAVIPFETPFFGYKTPEKTIYLRQRYYPYIWGYLKAAIVAGEKPSFLSVVGQPGIGKSFGLGNFLFMMVHATFKEEAAIVVVSIDNIDVIFANNRWTFGESTDSLERGKVMAKLKGLDYKALVVLHDAKTIGEQKPLLSLNGPFIGGLRDVKDTAAFHVVYLTSPGKTHHQRVPPIESIPDKDALVLPAWSLDELQALDEATSMSTRFSRRFYDFGGIIRWHCNPGTYGQPSLMQDALDRFSYATFATGSHLDESSPSALALILPDKSFMGFAKLTYVSERAQNLLKEKDLNGWYKVCTARVDVDSIDINRGSRGKWLELLFEVAAKIAAVSKDESVFKKAIYRVIPFNAASAPVQPIHQPPPVVDFIGLSFVGLSFAEAHITKEKFESELGNLVTVANETMAGKKLANKVFISMSCANTPVFDFALMECNSEHRQSQKYAQWKVTLFQTTVSKAHKLADTPAKTVMEYFKDNNKNNVKLEKFVFVGRAGNRTDGVKHEQRTNNKQDFFPDKQYCMFV